MLQLGQFIADYLKEQIFFGQAKIDPKVFLSLSVHSGIIIMIFQRFGFSSKVVIRYFVTLFVGLTLLFGFVPTAAKADSIPSTISFTPNLQIGLAASSRFAAQAEVADQAPMIPESRLNEMKEQRREWQSEVSAAAAAESEAENPENEAVKDKLNLDEITETLKPTADQQNR